ncbi:MAG: pitrilysin family protein [Candidatus Eisenbacteria bacterium]
MRLLPNFRIAALASAALVLLAAPLARRAAAADPAAATAYVVPKPIERGLKNQMRVLLIEDHRLPMIHYRLMLRAGASDEPAEKAGLANLMLDVMRQGTEKRDAKALSAAIDGMGGQVATAATRDYMVITGQFLARDWRSGLDLLADIAQFPSFRADEVERARNLVLGQIQQSRDQNAQLAQEHIDALVYGSHPYARPSNGDANSVTNLTREDLLKFHDQYFVPNLALLVVVGDFDVNTVMGDVEAQFRDWGQATPPSRPGPPLPVLESNRVRILDKPDVTQTELRIGFEGIKRDTPDYYAVQVMNYILGGGGFSSRILDAVRSKGGLTYTANTTFDFGRDKGAFFLSTFTKNESVGQTLDLMFATMKQFREQGPTPREVEDAKRFLVGAMPLALQTEGGLATAWSSVDLYNLGGNYFERYPDRIRAVTVDDVKRVAQQLLREDKLAIVAVSSAAAVKEQLAKFGPAEVLDYRSPTGAIPQSKPTAAMPTEALTPQAQARAKAVIERALKAHGGAVRLRALKDISTRAAISVSTPNGGIEGELLTSARLPDKVRIEMSMLGQRGVQVLNGDKGWTTSGGQVQDLSAEQAQAMRAGLKVQVVPLLARLATGTVTTGWTGADVVGADSVDVLWIVDPDANAKASFSRKTGLLVRLEQEEPAMFGQGKVPMARLYSDFRTVDGLVVPFKTERYAHGQLLISDTVSAYEVNRGGPETPYLKPTR